MASKSDIIVLERGMVKSKAWLSLQDTPMKAYLLFRCKCQIDTSKAARKRKLEERVANNGEIQFTYKEARDKYGFSFSRFARAVDQLVEKGFLDIAKTGSGAYRATTLYAISGRWRLYGTGAFQSARRTKPKYHPGAKFQRESSKEKAMDPVEQSGPEKFKPTRVDARGSTRTNARGSYAAARTNARGEKVIKIYNFVRGQWLCA